MTVEHDKQIGMAGDRALHVDLYAPDSSVPNKRTAVVLVHGGGWILGDKHMVEGLGKAFAALGYTAVAAEYRLVREAAWPAQLEDVSNAVRWVQDNADSLGVDADKVVVAGGSAGAHLAMLAAKKVANVAAVLALFPASELTVANPPPAGTFGAAVLFGEEASDETLRSASPLHQLDAEYPPTYLLHGADDWMIDPAASVNVYQRLVELGVPAELHVVAKALHEFTGEPSMCGPMVGNMGLFLDRLVVEPAKYAAETEEANLFAKGPEFVGNLMAQMLSGEGH